MYCGFFVLASNRKIDYSCFRFTEITKAIWWNAIWSAQPFEPSSAYKSIMSIKLADDKCFCIAKIFSRYELFMYHKGIDDIWYYSSISFNWFLEENKNSITLYLNDNNKKMFEEFLNA